MPEKDKQEHWDSYGCFYTLAVLGLFVLAMVAFVHHDFIWGCIFTSLTFLLLAYIGTISKPPDMPL